MVGLMALQMAAYWALQKVDKKEYHSAGWTANYWVVKMASCLAALWVVSKEHCLVVVWGVSLAVLMEQH